jgi:hypothetical protein
LTNYDGTKFGYFSTREDNDSDDVAADEETGGNAHFDFMIRQQQHLWNYGQ